MTGRCCTWCHVTNEWSSQSRAAHLSSHVKKQNVESHLAPCWPSELCRVADHRVNEVIWVIHNIIIIWSASAVCPLSTCSGWCQWKVRGVAGVGARPAWARQVATTTTQWAVSSELTRGQRTPASPPPPWSSRSGWRASRGLSAGSQTRPRVRWAGLMWSQAGRQELSLPH